MSARQPFVPGQGFSSSSRPDSRTAHNNATNDATTSAPLHFVADPSNPLNGGSIAGNVQKDRIENAAALPLNIGSLTRSNRAQNSAPSRRQSLQMPTADQISRPGTSDPHSKSHRQSLPTPTTNHPPRPGTSDPHSQSRSTAVPNHRLQAHALANSHGIIAPSPRQPRSASPMFSNNSASGMFSSSSFKTPALPVSRISPQKQPTTDARGLRAPIHELHGHPQSIDHQLQIPDQSNDNILTNSSAFGLMILPSQPGPHRIDFGANVVTDLTQDDEPHLIATTERNGRNKRGRPEIEDEDEGDEEHANMHSYGGRAKRFKAHQEYVEKQDDENAMYPRSSNDENIYAPLSSPHRVQEHDLQSIRPRESRNSNIQRSEVTEDYRAQAQYSFASSSHDSLDDLFLSHLLDVGVSSFDFDQDGAVQTYIRSTERWKTCPREEWMAGAEEMAAKYVKILDFVKNHVITKIQRFASIDEKKDQHKEVLKERDQLLDEEKERLVKNGGNVLGSK
ncbi:hypothetical protein B0H10DRAFT_2049781 [Mycena sp. CBHHK59/15]|nr:hypothetical protein B0H10DRAFT_2049781 [Mycena sp. CBHHK59/15]